MAEKNLIIRLSAHNCDTERRSNGSSRLLPFVTSSPASS